MKEELLLEEKRSKNVVYKEIKINKFNQLASQFKLSIEINGGIITVNNCVHVLLNSNRWKPVKTKKNQRNQTWRNYKNDYDLFYYIILPRVEKQSSNNILTSD